MAFCHKGWAICVSGIIDISPCNLDSSLCFIQPSICVIYSAYKLNTQGDFPNLEPFHFPMPVSTYCFLTCIQISQDAGKVVWYSHFFKKFSVCCDPHSQVFGIVKKADVGFFLELSCFFYDPTDVGNWISGSSAFSKFHLYIWKLSVHLLLKSSLKDFENPFASM